MRITETDALIVVDVQNDFCSGGALPVPHGEDVVGPINRVMGKFEHVAFSRDWHPSDHCSFGFPAEYKDGSWPQHCVQDTPGAEFHGDLRVPLDAIFVEKGDNPGIETYSAFHGTNLYNELRRHEITRIFVAGLALDFCVRATALDAQRFGFETVLLADATRPVTPEGGEDALRELAAAGIASVRSDNLS